MAKIKDSTGAWRDIKSGDKIKDANGAWQNLKDGDKVKDANGAWHSLGLSGGVITLKVVPSSLTFANIPEANQTVTVTLSNSDQSWEVDSKDSWITTTVKTSEIGLRVQPASNTPGNPARYGEIVLHSIENNDVKKIISVYQEAGD